MENPQWTIHGIKTDISQETDIVDAFQWIQSSFQHVDVLINNAAAMFRTNVLDGDMELWRKMFDVNVMGTGICTREALKIMSEEGHIVNIGSVQGLRIYRDKAGIYSATKHALRVITEAVRIRLAQRNSNIRVTLISPGLVVTEMTEHVFAKENGQNLPRIGPEDVAKSVNHVISTDTSVNITELTIEPTREVLI